VARVLARGALDWEAPHLVACQVDDGLDVGRPARRESIGHVSDRRARVEHERIDEPGQDGRDAHVPGWHPLRPVERQPQAWDRCIKGPAAGFDVVAERLALSTLRQVIAHERRPDFVRTLTGQSRERDQAVVALSVGRIGELGIRGEVPIKDGSDITAKRCVLARRQVLAPRRWRPSAARDSLQEAHPARVGLMRSAIDGQMPSRDAVQRVTRRVGRPWYERPVLRRRAGSQLTGTVPPCTTRT